MPTINADPNTLCKTLYFNIAALEHNWRSKLAEMGYPTTNLSLQVFECHRPTEEQIKRYNTLNADGTRSTNCDGIVSWSRHQDFPSTAVDFVVLLDNKMTWDTDIPIIQAAYEAIMLAAESLNLQSGGRWPRLRDYPHVQILEEDRVAEVQRLLKEDGYDCGKIDGALGPRTDAMLKKWTNESYPQIQHFYGRIHPLQWSALHK